LDQAHGVGPRARGLKVQGLQVQRSTGQLRPHQTGTNLLNNWNIAHPALQQGLARHQSRNARRNLDKSGAYGWYNPFEFNLCTGAA
jgi:hypothetical protein